MKKQSNQFIILKREKNLLLDRLRNYVVYINDQQVGKIKNGEEKKIKVDNGTHNVHLKIDWEGSNKLKILVKNKNVYLECGFNGGTKFLGRNYIYLRKKT